jgi:oligopeptide/dipeptide ABC transporter ATP-binding protein
MPLLDVRGLCVHFPTPQGLARAVDGATFTLEKGRTLALVGESGSGKSTTALAILGLHSKSTRISGSVYFEGCSLLDSPRRMLQTIRGRGISMIFQEAAASLNPIYTVGSRLAETVRLHRGSGRRAAWRTTLDLLRDVRLEPPDRMARRYPHELSGGMQQRVAIALALAGQPSLLVADEPISALDATSQKEIVDLLAELSRRHAMALLLISHDLDLVAQMADTLAVMYAGKIVETGPAVQIFQAPLHPYTAALLACRPHIGNSGRLRGIPGMVPPATDYPAGCRFRDRCVFADGECVREPPCQEHQPGRWAACWHHDRVGLENS